MKNEDNDVIEYASKKAKQAMNSPKRKKTLRSIKGCANALAFMRGFVNTDIEPFEFRVLIEYDKKAISADQCYYSIWINSNDLGIFYTPDYKTIRLLETPNRPISDLEIKRHLVISHRFGLGHLWDEETEKYHKSSEKKNNLTFGTWLINTKEPSELNAFLNKVYFKILTLARKQNANY